MSIDALADRLRPHYARFLSPLGERVLMTGHSHQAWPDVARLGHLEAWDDAARFIDRKWDRVFGEILPELQGHIAKRLGSSRPADLAFAPNTHELVFRLASCFPLDGPVLTTDSEFHSLRRQLARLAEGGARVVSVPLEAPDFAERFLDAARKERPAWAAISWVAFTTARLVTDLPTIAAGLADLDIPFLVDAYHAFNVVELEVDALPGDVFVTAGGYKYAECGEGLCFLLLPPDATRYRPLTTGWFADFEHLEAGAGARVEYGAGGLRFWGATFDPTPFYRARSVFRFMDEQGLTPRVLAAQSRAQTDLIFEQHRALGLESKLPIVTPRAARGGFVSFEAADAPGLVRALEARGVSSDARGNRLRFGPAPYVRTSEISRAMELLGELVHAQSGVLSS